VVIDTNVIISAIGKLSPNRKLFDAILSGDIEIYISNDIFLEYIEMLRRKTNTEITNNFVYLLSMLSNVHFTNIYFKWNVINQDPDDNKFVDCFIASNSDYLITNDKHFEKVKNNEFPVINIINSKDFIKNHLI
jgi:putative PIN family toxin of toxin-antitoxin system